MSSSISWLESLIQVHVKTLGRWGVAERFFIDRINTR
jgi:hypothetical protein